MKKVTYLIFFVFITIGYSQKKSNGLEKQNSNQFDISLATGISSPSSTFSDNSYAADGSFFELSSTYYFSKIGMGISLGSFSNPTEGNLLEFTNNTGYTLSNNSENWKTSYYGIGPNYRTNIGSLEAIIFTRAGLMAVKPNSLQSRFVVENADTPASIPVYNLNTSETSQSGFYTAGIKLGYKLNRSLSFYISANYLSSFSEDLEIEESRTNIQNFDLNRDGTIDQDEIAKLLGTQIDYQTSTINSKIQALNYGFGLSYSFGKRTIKIGGTEKPYARGNDGSDNQETIFNKPINSGTVVFTNPSKDKRKNQQKLVSILPKNKSVFKDVNSIKNFTWEIIGSKIPNPQFIIEVTKISGNQQAQRTYIGKTSRMSISTKEIFKDNNLSDGQYRWKVTETSTGNSSDVKFYTFSNCEIDFTISNEEIECLGYEGEDRKYKICFDSTYSSSSGDLTFVNPGSGLSVFDQAYAPLTYTMISPNPTLLTQVGTTTSTVSYCFEVTVSASVTSIGFGLQGDDLDPSPLLCQPGVSFMFDELPDCICDECEDIELSFDNFNISLNGATGNQFNFDGDINVNVPIYGIEFQVQSYSYSASPSACTEGVSSVEESGMILMPGTSINGSTSLQLFNETVSGSPSSNNNATKDIKYTSNSPLTGAIPVNLTIGLPGPISGLDPSCCVIDYTVCIKVKVFYEESNCKSCVFTHCFTFNNQ
ncbi:EF-hand domain-containing protein [Lutibacter flavus]|uniref:EF-hand domain-containing protein n=1 Tax=Lutibacter flavus TaxID=691689 RepID=A0A238YYG2_9FLAO|nr:hypothetical protein [Lutibacter flavus]SNR76256.1 hypothetical protein SAMN04488111_2942 [Lutibacter flavus]